MRKGEPWINLGYDESNHGRYPEICVVAVSNVSNDLIESPNRLRKIRRNNNFLSNRLKKRDYAFLDFSATAYELIVPTQKLGIVLANLINKKPIDDHLKFFVDGEWYKGAINYAKSILHETTGLEKDCIEIIDGAKLDRRIPLVNLADELAYWLYNTSHSKWIQSPIREHKQELYLSQFLRL
jgi:hypothetical protein